MKTAELEGAQLDYWVAKAEGHRVRLVGEIVVFYEGGDDSGLKERRGPQFSPSADWSDGGPIIEREKIELSYIDIDCWYARVNPYAAEPYGIPPYEGATPLIAAMRAYVASKFGDEVG